MSLMMGQGGAGRVGLEATERGLKEAGDGCRKGERQAGLPSSCSTRLSLGLDARSAPVSHSSVGWGKEVGKAGPERELGLSWHL